MSHSTTFAGDVELADGGGQDRAVGRERDLRKGGAATEGQQLVSGGDVEDGRRRRRRSPADDDEEAPIGAEVGEARGCGEGSAPLLDGMARVADVPEEDRAGGAGGHDDRPVWVPGDADQAGLAGVDGRQLSFAGPVPQGEGAVEARGDDDLGVGAEVDAPHGDDASAEEVAVRGSGDGVPGEHAVVGEADGDDLGAIRRELSDRPAHGADRPSAVAMDNRLERPGECVELPDRGFVGAGGDESTVGEEDASARRTPCGTRAAR